MEMTPRERVEAVLNGTRPDHVPFTVYEGMLPQCEVERQLRNEGLCIHNRHFSPMKSTTPNCTTETISYMDPETGKGLSKTVTHTPEGDLENISEPAGFTSWRHELPFKGPEDYPKLIALAEDTQFEPTYETYTKPRRGWGTT